MDEHKVIVDIELSGVPDQLTYNNVGLEDHHIECGWEIAFDQDGDGTSADDLKLSASRFKPPSVVEAKVTLLRFTQKIAMEQ